MTSRTAIFLDRDGTLIHDVGYPSRPEQVHLLPGVGTALRTLAARGLALVVISNQSGVGRGMLTREEAQAVHVRLIGELAREGVKLDAAYYCYHGPDVACPCRKPAPGLILEAADALSLDLGASFMVGNAQSDVHAGRSAGCRTIAFAALAATEADWAVPTWPEVVDVVLSAVRAA